MQEFSLDLPNGITISSLLSETEVSAQPGVNIRDMKNGYVWYTFPEIEIKGEKIVFSLCFFENAIQSLNISVSNPGLYGGGWNEFSETKEKARAKDTEKWLSSIGYKTGKYSWGEVNADAGRTPASEPDEQPRGKFAGSIRKSVAGVARGLSARLKL